MTAGRAPGEVALEDGERRWTFGALEAAAADLSARLRAQGTRVLATMMDNSAAWVVADRAAADAAIVHVPMPAFFSNQQTANAVAAAGVDTVLAAPALAARWPGASAAAWPVAESMLSMLRLPTAGVGMPPATVKVTFTSGSTGSPKGVCLSAEAMDRVAAGLAEALAPLGIRRHLCALPFAVLLENVAGLLAPWRGGASCIVLPLQALGLTGSSSFDAARFHETVVRQQPHSVIVLPQMLRAWVAQLRASHSRAPESLKLVAVGGAAVGAQVLQAARALGVPAFEGYGLSEAGSVQTLNLPGSDRIGSAGRPLPHARMRVAADGEIEVRGSLFAGYLGDPSPVPEWWSTGDLGRIDGDGFVHVQGRRKHVLITAFGRNVSPEWVETALRQTPAIGHAVVLGDGQPALSAVLWPARDDASDAELQAAVDSANASLPDYARVHRWTRARAAFTAQAGMATANGRPLRGEVRRQHAAWLDLPSTEAVSDQPAMNRS